MKRPGDKCNTSETGHSVFPQNHTRDDSGFYCKCVNCGEMIFFDCDTLTDFYNCFEDYDDGE
jgi:hypothetical protein